MNGEQEEDGQFSAFSNLNISTFIYQVLAKRLGDLGLGRNSLGINYSSISGSPRTDGQMPDDRCYVKANAELLPPSKNGDWQAKRESEKLATNRSMLRQSWVLSTFLSTTSCILVLPVGAD